MVEPAQTRRVLVDMTPLEPGGQNGGAGLVATSLVREMSALRRGTQFTLLTADSSHAELGALDAPNVERVCVAAARRSQGRASQLIDRVLPSRMRTRLKRAYRSLRTRQRVAGIVDMTRPDLVFCPFTETRYWRPGVPCVSIVHDLQHLAYPEFFTPDQRLNRQHAIDETVERCVRVVCISEYVRGTLLAGTGCAPEQAVTIRLGLLHERLPADPRTLLDLGLQPGQFLLYPANFWPHKNHLRLFAALNLYNQEHPADALRLVCTGAPNALMRRLQADAPADFVVFAGYVDDSQLMALFEGCAAVVFPSLYEGFGMPVLEAMASGKPVVCSDLPSLREVAQDTAVYFDPTNPAAIAHAIGQLSDQPALASRIHAARLRAAQLGTARDMAARYIDLFETIISRC